MTRPTRTDPGGGNDGPHDDEPVHLRLWGTHHLYMLPAPTPGKHWLIGASKESWLRMQDAGRFVSRRHAALVREREGWLLRDLGSKNGTYEFNLRRSSIPIVPGVEIGIGAHRLIAESPRLVRLRGLFARMIGWDDDRSIQLDRAVRRLREAAALRHPLYIVGDGDLVVVARRIHREVAGVAAPFVVADPRRLNREENTRAPRNCTRGLDGLAAASGGTLCLWAERLPGDFNEVLAKLDSTGSHVRLVICARTATKGTIAIHVTPLSERRSELKRVIAEYAEEAIATLRASPYAFTDRDLAWLLARRPKSLADIERSTLRLVALREGGGITRAAALLGISHGSLSRWLGRSGLP